MVKTSRDTAAWIRAMGFVAGFLLSVTLLLSSCGKKAAPVVPGQLPMVAVSDLDATLEQTYITLTWTHPKENSRVRNYIVLRAQTDLARLEECTGCPMVFQKVGVRAVEKEGLQKAGSLAFSMDLPKGFRYTFSVRPSQSSGAQGSDSNLVEVMLPK